MLMNDTGDSSQENLATSTPSPAPSRTPATLLAVLSALVVLAALAVATMPGQSSTMVAVNGALAVVAAAGVRAALRARNHPGGRLNSLALACALGSAVAVVVLRLV
ncbi:hypothetical protein ABZ896_29660 [Streptomyces sp. NPDC047072]|uniref:hypothetical protein n=1 Tax=Streptomyces sp. NPDC047072 TaxID=3154809 RepID=UPI0033EE844F